MAIFSLNKKFVTVCSPSVKLNQVPMLCATINLLPITWANMKQIDYFVFFVLFYRNHSWTFFFKLQSNFEFIVFPLFLPIPANSSTLLYYRPMRLCTNILQGQDLIFGPCDHVMLLILRHCDNPISSIFHPSKML